MLEQYKEYVESYLIKQKLDMENLENYYLAKKSIKVFEVVEKYVDNPQLMKAVPLKNWFMELTNPLYIGAILDLEATGANEYLKDMTEWSEDFINDYVD